MRCPATPQPSPSIRTERGILIVDTLEIPELPDDDLRGEDPRVWHDAAALYLARALDGRGTEANAHRAAACLRRVLRDPVVAGWPLARSFVRHDLALANLLAAEVATGLRERRLLLRAREHLEAAAADGGTGWPPRHRGRLLHNLGYVYERLAELDADDGAATAAARAYGASRAVYAMAGQRAPA